MQYLLLLVSLLLCTSQTCHTMELIKMKKHDKKNNSKPEPTQIRNVHLDAAVYKPQNLGFGGADCTSTQLLMKGVDLDDIPIIQRSIAKGGDVNYTYPYNSQHMADLNLIQIACASREYKTVKALLTSPDIDLYTHRENTLQVVQNISTHLVKLLIITIL